MCRGMDGAARLQDLHVDVVLNLLQPSLWVHRHEERKTLELLGLPKKGLSHPSASASRSQTPAGTAEPCLRLLLPARLVQGMFPPQVPPSALEHLCSVTKQSDPPAILLCSEALSGSQDIDPSLSPPASARHRHEERSDAPDLPSPQGCCPGLLPDHWRRICPSGSHTSARHTPVP